MSFQAGDAIIYMRRRKRGTGCDEIPARYVHKHGQRHLIFLDSGERRHVNYTSIRAALPPDAKP